MTTPLFQIDAFTSEPYHGNPAAVCLLEEQMPDKWMLSVAQEMNLSETAFLLPEGDGYRLRWFTPAVEEKLCGHATLASAHALWASGRVSVGLPIRFHTLSGELTAGNRSGLIELNFPATPPKEVEPPPSLAGILGIQPLYTGKSQFDYILEVDDEDVIYNLKPDFQRLKEIETRGVIITSRTASQDYDFISRFFAPRDGIDEDPVTGSAHCCLGPYWSTKLGKSSFKAFQASPRGGVLQVKLENDRVVLGGEAVTIFEGVLHH